MYLLENARNKFFHCKRHSSVPLKNNIKPAHCLYLKLPQYPAGPFRYWTSKYVVYSVKEPLIRKQSAQPETRFHLRILREPFFLSPSRLDCWPVGQVNGGCAKAQLRPLMEFDSVKWTLSARWKCRAENRLVRTMPSLGRRGALRSFNWLGNS